MIKVFDLNGVVVNVDNDEDAQKLIDQGAEEIDPYIFGEHANWACCGNTKKVADVWTFTPDMAAINKSIEESEEFELDMKLTELVGNNPQDKIAKLQSMSLKPDSIAMRYLNKLIDQVADAESELSKFI